MPVCCQIGFYLSESHDIPITLLFLQDEGDPDHVVKLLSTLMTRYQEERAGWDASAFAPWVIHEFVKAAILRMQEEHIKSKGEFYRKDGYDFQHFTVTDFIHSELNYFYRLDNPVSIKIMGGRGWRRIEEEISVRSEYVMGTPDSIDPE